MASAERAHAAPRHVVVPFTSLYGMALETSFKCVNEVLKGFPVLRTSRGYIRGSYGVFVSSNLTDTRSREIHETSVASSDRFPASLSSFCNVCEDLRFEQDVQVSTVLTTLIYSSSVHSCKALFDMLTRFGSVRVPESSKYAFVLYIRAQIASTSDSGEKGFKVCKDDRFDHKCPDALKRHSDLHHWIITLNDLLDCWQEVASSFISRKHLVIVFDMEDSGDFPKDLNCRLSLPGDVSVVSLSTIKDDMPSSSSGTFGMVHVNIVTSTPELFPEFADVCPVVP